MNYLGGFSIDSTDFGAAQPFLTQLLNSGWLGVTVAVNTELHFIVTGQSATELRIHYSARVSTYYNFSGDIVISGTGLTYTHDYSAYGIDYVDGTVTGGTVNSISITNVDAAHAGGYFSSVRTTSGVLQNVGLGLVDLMANGISFSGNDAIAGTYLDAYLSVMGVESTGVGYAQTLSGGAGNDGIWGGVGDDTIDGGAGADSLYGGDGVDILSFVSAASGQYAHLGLGQDTDGDVFSGFENLVGSNFGDWLAGSDAANNIQGGDSNDVIAAGIGDDFILGGNGNDTIYSEAGVDIIDGGDGFDILNCSLLSGPLTIDLGSSLIAGDTVTSIEGVVGTAFADTIIGTSGADAISGNAGNDVIVLGGGADYLNFDNSDIVAGQFDYVADFSAEDRIYASAAHPFYVFAYGSYTYAITAVDGGYYSICFDGGASVALIQSSIDYYVV